MDELADIQVASPPENFRPGKLASSVVLFGNLIVYGFTVYNTGSAQYLNIFDTGTLPAENAVPIFSWAIPANQGVAFAYPTNGARFKTGLVICNSSTDTKKTIGAADCFFDVQYQALYALTSEVY